MNMSDRHAREKTQRRLVKSLGTNPGSLEGGLMCRRISRVDTRSISERDKHSDRELEESLTENGARFLSSNAIS